MKRMLEYARRCAAAFALGALLTLATTSPLRAQAPSDTAAVLATAQRLFDAMAQRDTAAARAVLGNGMRFSALRSDTSALPARAQADTSFLRSLANGQQHFLERMWSPVVKLQGPIATVWTPYDFHIDGKWSHCGIDTFTLLRTDAGWQIVALAYTVQRRDCPASPLGPPKP
jgi:hypothetical protein